MWEHRRFRFSQRGKKKKTLLAKSSFIIHHVLKGMLEILVVNVNILCCLVHKMLVCKNKSNAFQKIRWREKSLLDQRGVFETLYSRLEMFYTAKIS